MSYTRAMYVRFHCAKFECDCDVEVLVHACITRDGGRLYEYSTSNCPKCGHKLFGDHDLLGEVARDSGARIA
ncbi:MAG TPA: hypothetical protein VER58_18260 [Thermoanaerobaculia bacterium]|nr:hypothetical protein [Thermoanaerobaculia bacterium]